MTGSDSDLSYSALLDCSASVSHDYLERSRAWESSPFHWLVTVRGPSARGAAAAKILTCYLSRRGFHVASAGSSSWDRLINNRRVEIKFAALWDNGHYAFQQIRDQDYEFVVMLGFSPQSAHAWLASKRELFDHPEDVRPQHGGSGGTDTKWLKFRPDAQPQWLRPPRGDLTAFVDELRAAL